MFVVYYLTSIIISGELWYKFEVMISCLFLILAENKVCLFMAYGIFLHKALQTTVGDIFAVFWGIKNNCPLELL